MFFAPALAHFGSFQWLRLWMLVMNRYQQKHRGYQVQQYLFTPPLSFISRTQNDSAGVKLMACAKAIALKHQLVGLTYPKPLKLVTA